MLTFFTYLNVRDYYIVLKQLYRPWLTHSYKNNLQESTFILVEAITRANTNFNISSVVKNNLTVYFMVIFLHFYGIIQRRKEIMRGEWRMK